MSPSPTLGLADTMALSAYGILFKERERRWQGYELESGVGQSQLKDLLSKREDTCLVVGGSLVAIRRV